MRRDIDHEIAELIMGESQPAPPTLYMDTGEKSGEWMVESGRWVPRPYSSQIDEAMRAVEKFSGGEPTLLMEYYRNKQTGELEFMAYDDMKYGYGDTLPEAICNLLLKLARSKDFEFLQQNHPDQDDT